MVLPRSGLRGDYRYHDSNRSSTSSISSGSRLHASARSASGTPPSNAVAAAPAIAACVSPLRRARSPFGSRPRAYSYRGRRSALPAPNPCANNGKTVVFVATRSWTEPTMSPMIAPIMLLVVPGNSICVCSVATIVCDFVGWLHRGPARVSAMRRRHPFFSSRRARAVRSRSVRSQVLSPRAGIPR